MEYQGKNFSMYQGDCVQIIKQIPDNSIHFPIFSPPFANLYIYSDDLADMGNCKSIKEFFKQFDFLIPELLRVTIPGRVCAVHCKQLPKYKSRDGRSGLIDFRGEIIRHFEAAGWQYHSEVLIWTDPVLEMQKTKPQGLLYCQLRKDATHSRMGMAEYLLIFRKWDNDTDAEPVTHNKQDFPLEKWQNYASCVWMDVRRTNTLNAKMGRENEDEKHICPLQLDTIERAIDMYSNPGDIVFSPFAGIGSEIYQALKMNRRGVGIELKESYYKKAVENCKEVESECEQPTLFDYVEKQRE